MNTVMRFITSGLLLIGVCALQGCVNIRERQGTYSYLGRVVEKVEDVDLSPQQHSNPASIGVVGSVIYTALKRNKKYRRYTVALEMGEKLSLRAVTDELRVGDCARVWIIGPGVSPVYLYMPDQADIGPANDCKR